MMRLLILVMTLLLAGCDSPQEYTPTETHSDRQSPGFVERASEAAVAGAAAGAAGTVAHRATDHAINKFKTHRRAKRIKAIRMRRR